MNGGERNYGHSWAGGRAAAADLTNFAWTEINHGELPWILRGEVTAHVRHPQMDHAEADAFAKAVLFDIFRL